MTEALMLMKPRSRCTWTAAERAEWLALFQRSGQTAAEFCRDNDLSPATLSIWRQQTQTLPSSDEGLVEVPMPTFSEPAAKTPVPTVPAVTVRLPDGMQIQIVAGTDPTWLSQLLRALSPARS